MPITVVDGDGYQPPATAEPDCEWPIIMDCSPSEAFEPEVVERAKISAADVMNAATARRFGVCTSTFEVLEPEPCQVGHQDAWGYVDPKIGVDTGAARFNAFYRGAATSDGCSWFGCGTHNTTKLRLWHRRVLDVLQVVIDGVVLDSSAYRLDGNVLVRTDGSDWPTTADWYVTYRHGIPLPAAGQIATGILACEIAMALSDDDDCSLPARTKTYTNHAGLTIGFIDPMEFLIDGLTGLYVPDQWIRRMNPHGLARRARAYSYGKQRRHGRRVPNPFHLNGGFPPVYTGDINETVTVRLDGVEDLTGVTAIEAHVWTDPGTVTVLDAVVADATARTVTVDLGDGVGWLANLVQDPGEIVLYNLQVEATFGVDELTWPADILTVIGQAA